MNISQCLSAALLSVGLCTAYAQSSAQLGNRLSPTEQAQLGFTATHTVGQSTVKTVAPATINTRSASASSSSTTVINEQGVVGISRNEVLISQWPTANVRSQVSGLLAEAQTVTYYDHLKITSLRYASFAQAVAARERLAAALPKAMVSLPITYDKKNLR